MVPSKLSTSLVVLLCLTNALTIASEKRAAKFEILQEGKKGLKGLSTDIGIEGKSFPYFGGMPAYGNPPGGFFPSHQGTFGTGGFPSNPYLSPYGFMGNPMNYGGFYPFNPGFYGNSFGGFSTTQQQQQQQMSQVGTGGVTGAEISGLHPSFAG